MEDLISRVFIIAVGNENYQDPQLPRLIGVKNDLENIRYFFLESKKTSIFNNKHYTELKDCSSYELRKTINDFILSRSADNDILIFYFAGHGVAIGRNDFGFCTNDTIIHLLANVVLPSSVFTFSELLQSLYISNIIPVIIIDSCYSGIAGKGLLIPPIEAIDTIHDQLHKLSASTFALLCSCSENQQSHETIDGGIFSNCLLKVANEGRFSKEKFYLTLFDLYQELVKEVYISNLVAFPRLYLGSTLPEFPICKNHNFSPQTYSLVKHLVEVLVALWNEGSTRYLNPKEIDQLCGKGAYGNHNKLSLAPWGLVEDSPIVKKRALSKRGAEFMKGELRIPYKIIQDPKTGVWNGAKGTKLVSIMDVKPQEKLL